MMDVLFDLCQLKHVRRPGRGRYSEKGPTCSCLDLTRQIERSLASEKLSCRGACMNTKPISTEDYCTVC